MCTCTRRERGEGGKETKKEKKTTLKYVHESIYMGVRVHMRVYAHTHQIQNEYLYKCLVYIYIYIYMTFT